MTHYDVLGVPRGATARQIREAFRARARDLHPDRLIDASPREREQAAREMQRVTQAWHVLGDTRRRRAYDETLEPAGTRHYAETTLGDDDLVDVAPGVHAGLMRGLPWVVLVVVLVLIFVFTAYAGPDDDEPTGGSTPGSAVEVGECIAVQGSSIAVADCDAENDGQVVAVVEAVGGCPNGTRALAAPDGRVLCVAA